jgi:acyl carrier protein
MTTDEARDLMKKVLREIAPEADLDEVGPEETMQEALDLDSVDYLNFIAGLAAATGLTMPERDYALLATVDGCVRYLVAGGAP